MDNTIIKYQELQWRRGWTAGWEGNIRSTRTSAARFGVRRGSQSRKHLLHNDNFSQHTTSTTSRADPSHENTSPAAQAAQQAVSRLQFLRPLPPLPPDGYVFNIITSATAVAPPAFHPPSAHLLAVAAAVQGITHARVLIAHKHLLRD